MAIIFDRRQMKGDWVMVSIDYKEILQSMTEFDYVVMGGPLALARPRMGKRCLFDNQKMQKLTYGIDIERQHGNRKMYGGKLLLLVRFFMEIKAKRNTNKLLGTYHHFRPDLSNLIKFVEDAATGVIFNDDCIISAIIADKVWSDKPRTCFSIIEL